MHPSIAGAQGANKHIRRHRRLEIGGCLCPATVFNGGESKPIPVMKSPKHTNTLFKV